MPNADQFAEWITGERDGLISSDWRPSRLMMGDAVWDGTKVDIEFTHTDRQPLGHKCFIRGFVSSIPAAELPGRKRNSAFPKDSSEALALTALELAQHKLTMVFVAQKRSTEPFGNTLLKCIKLRRLIAEQGGESFELSIAPVFQVEVDRCIALIREHMGDDSDHVKFLQKGFVIHHGSIPQPVRIAIEKLVRSGVVRLVVATTTLAQGVNFPIHTVLVHSLDQGHDQPVSPMDFWNICGRAGRGMKENEGQVLFFVKRNFEEWNDGKTPKFKKQSSSWRIKKWEEWCEEQRKFRESYLLQYGTYQVQSGLLYLLNQVTELWKEKHGSVNVPELCESLANNLLDMFASSETVNLESLLSTLDGLLLAMTEESESEEITPDTFQELLCRSLVHLQLATPQERAVVNETFSARVRYIRSRHPDRAKRLQFYQLGLPLKDCEFIEEHRLELLTLYLKASEYKDWSLTQRAAHISDITDYLFQLTEIAPDSIPTCARRILELWLDGKTPSEILADSEVQLVQMSSHDVSRWIDDVFAYRLPWGLNSLSCYLKQHSEAEGHEWPDVCDYYSAFVKYGVNDLVVCWLMAAGVSSRTAAARIGKLIGDQVDTPESMLIWLRTGGIDQLLSEGLTDVDAEILKNAVLISDVRQKSGDSELTIRLRHPIAPNDNLAPGTRLLLDSISEGNVTHQYRLLTLSGSVVAQFKLESPILSKLMISPEFVTAIVVDPINPEHAEMLHVQFNSL
jgi:hypothetical protein